MAGGEYFDYQYQNLEARVSGAPTDDIPTLNAGTNRTYTTSVKTGYRILSGFARVNYDYNYRYMVSLVARYDGISKLSDNRWGFFEVYLPVGMCMRKLSLKIQSLRK